MVASGALVLLLLAAAAAAPGAARQLGAGASRASGVTVVSVPKPVAKGKPKGAPTSGPFPYDAYDRKPRWAKGRKAGGQPDPIQGLATPDAPILGPDSASMEGQRQAHV
jgi:hypothetical protein